MKPHLLLAACLLVFSTLPQMQAGEKLKALIIDGQNNHSWKTTTPALKWIFEDSGRFTVDVSTTPPSLPPAPAAPKADASPEAKAAEAQKRIDAIDAQINALQEEKTVRMSAVDAKRLS